MVNKETEALNALHSNKMEHAFNRMNCRMFASFGIDKTGAINIFIVKDTIDIKDISKNLRELATELEREKGDTND